MTKMANIGNEPENTGNILKSRSKDPSSRLLRDEERRLPVVITIFVKVVELHLT
jgi:hypothetical protein